MNFLRSFRSFENYAWSWNELRAQQQLFFKKSPRALRASHAHAPSIMNLPGKDPGIEVQIFLFKISPEILVHFAIDTFLVSGADPAWFKKFLQNLTQIIFKCFSPFSLPLSISKETKMECYRCFGKLLVLQNLCHYLGPVGWSKLSPSWGHSSISEGFAREKQSWHPYQIILNKNNNFNLYNEEHDIQFVWKVFICWNISNEHSFYYSEICSKHFDMHSENFVQIVG